MTITNGKLQKPAKNANEILELLKDKKKETQQLSPGSI
jgi:hypothetical protein